MVDYTEPAFEMPIKVKRSCEKIEKIVAADDHLDASAVGLRALSQQLCNTNQGRCAP